MAMISDVPEKGSGLSEDHLLVRYQSAGELGRDNVGLITRWS